MTADQLVQLLVKLAATLVAAGVVWDKALGPFLARPLVRALRKVISVELGPIVDERVTAHEVRLLQETGHLARRVSRLERLAGVAQDAAS